MTETPAGSPLAAALAEFQKDLPRLGKDNTGTIRSDKANYSYKYADLPEVSKLVLPLLARHGMSFTAMPTLDDAGRFVLEYTLRHTGGESAVGRYPLPTSGSPQQIGSAITYARRYTLCAVTGIAPDEDDDGAAAEQAYHDQQARAVAEREQRQDPPKDPELYRERALSRDVTVEQLRQLHGTASAAGVLGAEVTDADGAPTTLGDLIVARGKALAPKAAA